MIREVLVGSQTGRPPDLSQGSRPTGADFRCSPTARPVPSQGPSEPCLPAAPQQLSGLPHVPASEHACCYRLFRDTPLSTANLKRSQAQTNVPVPAQTAAQPGPVRRARKELLPQQCWVSPSWSVLCPKDNALTRNSLWAEAGVPLALLLVPSSN